MKRTIVALIALSSFGTFAKSANLTELQKSLNDMQPLSISDDRGIITVVLNEASITSDIYDNAILGVCSPAWMNSNNSAYLKNTKEVHILNKFSYSGYAFESPRTTCDEAGKLQPDESKVTLLSKTRLYTNK